MRDTVNVLGVNIDKISFGILCCAEAVYLCAGIKQTAVRIHIWEKESRGDRQCGEVSGQSEMRGCGMCAKG